MSASFLLSVLSTVITAIFSLIVLNRYRERGGMHLLVWGIGLILYTIATASQARLFLGWGARSFRLWYWAGAMLVAAWLGQGTAHLLIRRGRIAMAFLVVLTAVSVIALVLVFMLPLNPQNFALPNWITRYREILPPVEMPLSLIVRIILTIVLNTYGAVLLVGGALYSAWLFMRKQILPNRVLGNVLIAAGGLANSVGGTLAAGGRPEFLPLSQIAGAILILVGFSLAVAGAPQPAPQQAGS